MQKLLVTGGLGFIGAAFVRRAARRGLRPVVIDLDTYAGDERRLKDLAGGYDFVRGDVASRDCAAMIERAAPQVIVHFAAESHVTRSESGADLFFRTNVEGTHNVFDTAERIGVQRVVHVSTDEVYGPCHGTAFSEQDKQPGEGLATSAYARSKALADDLALSFADRVPVVVVRPTNCFGPWQHPEKAISRWITRLLRGGRIPVWGDGQQVRDWMHVEDACAGIEALIEKGASGDVYNLAPQGSQVTNLQMATMVAEAGDAGPDAVYLTVYDRPQHDRRYAINASKIGALGWRPQRSLEEHLGDTVEWYRNNRWWWEPLIEDAEAIYDDATGRS